MRSPNLTIVASLTSLILCAPAANAGDWPMWRYDANRSGASPENLPDQLHVQWIRHLPRPQTAWPDEPRLQFDSAYHPIAVGGRLFIASPNDGSVTAYDGKTGQEIWKFYTDGPIRLAPVAWKDRIYVGSDDGNLYCLDAHSGTLRWKVTGAPADRGDHRHLGNNRLVSYWPVRGGPVCAGDTIYFGAGIWPSMGVFIHAIDAETGKTRWTNATSHRLDNIRIDHNKRSEVGLSPQGHLFVVGDKLWVPNGRSMPAGFDRNTGKLLHYVQGYRNGDSRVAANETVALVGETGVLNLADGREVGSRWAQAGPNAPEDFNTAKMDLFEGPFHPYKLFKGCDFRSVLYSTLAIGMHDGVVCAYDLARSSLSLYEVKQGTHTLKPARWDAPVLWKLDTDLPKSKVPTRAMIKAGNRFYAHVGNTLVAVEIPTKENGKPALAWTKKLESAPVDLLAADGKLFAVLADGSIVCLGSEAQKPHDYPLVKKPIPKSESPWTQTVADLLALAPTKAGYALVLGAANPRLIDELLRQSDLRLLVVDPDKNKVDSLRDRIGTYGLHGPRFQALLGEPFSFPFPAYVADLIVCDEPFARKFDPAASAADLYEHLRPYGGVACFQASAEKRDALADTLARADLPNAKIETPGRFVTLRRVGALPGSAPWTHETGDAARSFYSRDSLVKAPLGVLWYGDGPDHGFYKHKDYGHGIKPQAAGGRLFALRVATQTLHAIDAYTGRLLWIHKVGPSARYASMPDAVYVAAGLRCIVLDAKTGQPRNTFSLQLDQADATPISASDIRVDGDVILIAVRRNAENRIERGRWNSTVLVALDRETGKKLWARVARNRYNTAAIALAQSTVYCIDSHSPMAIDAMKRRGQSTESLPVTILAIDARTGTPHWEKTLSDPPDSYRSFHFMGLRIRDDWLAYAADHRLLLVGRGEKTYALDAETGRQIWKNDVRGYQPLILGGDTFINQTGRTYDTRTGKLLDDTPIFQTGGCNYAVGGKNLLFLRAFSAAYVDRDSRKQYKLRNLRSGCSNSFVAADGLLNVPCFSVGCVCNYPIQTSFAMMHMPQAGAWSDRIDANDSSATPKQK